MYQTLKKIYHSSKEKYGKAYTYRYNSEYSRHIDIKINGNPAFYIVTNDIQKLLVDIRKLDKITSLMSSELPPIANSHLINKCIIDEITITNKIEGVESSRREIESLINYESKNKSNIKFSGLVEKYSKLIDSENIKLATCNDVRKIYDELVLKDVLLENKDHMPDGKIFRKGSVSVYDNGKEVHKGLVPESKIISAMNYLLKWINNEDEDLLLRIAAAHYLIGYIHPFYNGNGRLNRFISSYLLTFEFHPFISFRLACTIREKFNKYTGAFKECNHILNRGDITFFCEYFLNLVKDSFESLNKMLDEKLMMLNMYNRLLQDTKYSDHEFPKHLVYILIQAELFSEKGISISDLIYHLDISRFTLRKRLQQINNFTILKENIVGREKFYSIDLAKLEALLKNNN